MSFNTTPAFSESELQEFINDFMTEVVNDFVEVQTTLESISIFFDEASVFNNLADKLKKVKAVVDFLQTHSEFLFIGKVNGEEITNVKFSYDSEFGLTPDLAALRQNEVILSLKFKAEEGEEIVYPLTQKLKNELLKLPILRTVD